MSKILVFVFLSFMLMGVSKCPNGKYLAPIYENCTILTVWDVNLNADTATLFCIDDRLDSDYFTNTLIPRVMKMYNEHPLKATVEKYLMDNKDLIIKNKEYELPISYGRGFSTMNQDDKTQLIKWAEDNRMGRIKCEYNQDNI